MPYKRSSQLSYSPISVTIIDMQGASVNSYFFFLGFFLGEGLGSPWWMTVCG